MDILGTRCQFDMTKHRPAFLRQASHVDHSAAFAFEMRGHADNRPDGHHARPADTRNNDGIIARQRFIDGLRKIKPFAIGNQRCRFFNAGTMQRDKGGTKPFDTRKILVAT